MMTAKEFKDSGLLQEVNRQFLQIFGVAIMVQPLESGEYVFAGIVDNRDDPEGMYFGMAPEVEGGHDPVEFRRRAEMVQNEWNKRAAVRQKNLGWVVQPLP